MMHGKRVQANVYPILRQRAVRDASLTVLAAAALATGLVGLAGLSPVAVLKAMAVPIALIVLVAPHLDQHPASDLGPANQLTLGRAVLVAGLAAFVAEPVGPEASWALVAVAALAFALDGVDGRVARATGTASPFGARLDMELDGLTVLVLAALAFTMGRAGAWVLLAGLARPLFIGAGRIWPFLAAPLPPASRRAAACGLGITLLVASLAPWGIEALSPNLAALGTAVLVGSFAVDVVWLVRRHRAG